jgi:hypothetical protein
MKNNIKYIKLWEARKVEIEETGNCIGHLGAPYFTGTRSQYTVDEMLAYCDKMIDKLKANKNED